MDELRLFLIFIGVALVAGVYWWESRRRVARRDDVDRATGGLQQPFQDSAASVAVAPLDQARDEHAARNARALVGLEDFDIDSDADVIVRPPLEQSDGLASQQRVAEPEEKPTGFFGDDPAHGPTRAQSRGATEGEAPGCDAVAEAEQAPMIRVKARRSGPQQLNLDGLTLSAAPRRADEDQSSAGAEDAETDREEAGRGEATPVVLTLMATSPAQFSGADLKRAFQAESLSFGENRLYHRYQPGQALRSGPMFSVVNVVNPGVFNPDELVSVETPGLAIFMDAGTVKEPTSVFDEMLATVKRLAERLDGRVCDQNRSPLTTQAINHLRETVAEHARRKMLRS